jgi:hypothetical protein
MSSLSPLLSTFRARRDDFSVQISCHQDPKFWFRLEEKQERDHISDFFLGNFDPALAGDLLAMCYQTIGRSPRARLVFSDILSSKPGDPHTIDTAKRRFEDYTKAMLAYYGCSIGSAKILPRREKIDLIIDTDRPPGAFAPG